MALEAVGVALAANSFLKPIASLVQEVLKKDESHSSDFEELQFRFDIEYNKLSALEELLFSPNKLEDGKFIFSEMPEETRVQIVDLNGQLYELFEQFLRMREKYGLFQPLQRREEFDSFICFKLGKSQEELERNDEVGKLRKAFLQQNEAEEKDKDRSKNSARRRLRWSNREKVNESLELMVI